MLERAPIFLRVVELGGKWDALDQVDDTPEPMETIHVYRIQGEVGRMHVLRRGKGQKSGWFVVAEYVHVKPEPDEDEVRRTDAWQSWCRRNAPSQP